MLERSASDGCGYGVGEPFGDIGGEDKPELPAMGLYNSKTLGAVYVVHEKEIATHRGRAINEDGRGDEERRGFWRHR